MAKDNIIIIGGYGHVGKIICIELSKWFPGKVFAAGRSLERATEFSQQTAGKVQPMQLNIHEPIAPSILEQVKVVIMCLDQENTALVRACLQHGAHYMDITANGAFLHQVEQCHQEARAYQTTALLSAGLAPGLTNLLALQATQLMDQTEELNISLMLGLGDEHGQAAIEWTVDQIHTDLEVMEEGRPVMRKSFTDGKVADFGAGVGRHRAYRFPFSDQQILPRTLGIPTVSTRLCFDSRLTTRLLAGLRTTGLSGLLRQQSVRDVVVRSFSKLHLGGNGVAVKVDARGTLKDKQTEVECQLRGHQQSNLTAKAAVFAALALYRSELPYGVFHMEQCFAWSRMRDWLGQLVAVEIQVNGQHV
ncbi:saccharopine dehydrogenase [Paenibacillus kribbensis]|uniref:Saccharopine dehydrogenase n=1 Tax=Paenibacillus kribbensis TaxID=172713 RepID=A0A222WR25_9BACL|nr:saccharopine dehydrogenase NADP-binding domain-containing protein [Paenibacillus kribbensis]ASR48458.1 saccharopine dehydrogenase [Paenibacillus kribbensis]